MSKKDDGGPAFPTQADGWNPKSPGMTLRDYLAGQALAGVIRGDDSEPGEEARRLAKKVVRVADAVIAELRKNGGE